jgi:hypothetical protein
MTDRELMQHALEALELLAKYENPETKIQVRKPKDGGRIITMYPHKVATDAAAPLRKRLAQPEQEPVAWITNGGNGELWWHRSSKFDEEGNLIGPNQDDIPLYTAPPKKEWIGLTSDDIHDAFCHAEYDASQDWNDDPEGWCKAFANYVEAKLKEKNT